MTLTGGEGELFKAIIEEWVKRGYGAGGFMLPSSDARAAEGLKGRGYIEVGPPLAGPGDLFPIGLLPAGIQAARDEGWVPHNLVM